MRKAINLIIIINILLISYFVLANSIKAKTLGDLKDELKKTQEEYNKNEEQKALTEEEIKQTNSEIVTIKKNISQTYTDIENIQNEIANLYNKISEKKKEVKQILNYIQVSSGESAYLEYVFGAESFTDLIYRTAVAEQLSSYNQKLVLEYNSMIEESKKKQEEIQKKQVSLGTYQKELEEKVESLGKELEEEKSTSLTVSDEIKMQKEIIEMYESKGCTNSEDIATCGTSVLPKGTAFYRPTLSGYIISEWGRRNLLGSDWHEGIDVSVPEGTPVYAVATGMVASLKIPDYSRKIRDNCGGNMVIAHHNINGKTYTTVYAHLLSISVSAGDTITKNTIIGYSGGSSTKSYDPCTTGAHLHLTVATGHYGKDYRNWSYELNRVHAIDPRSVINFPSGRQRWNDRITAY